MKKRRPWGKIALAAGFAGAVGYAIFAAKKRGLFSPKGQRILLVGDSLSVGKASPGGQLARLLIAAGAEVRVLAVGGFTALQWLQSPHLQEIQNALTLQPSIAIVFLGTNESANIAAKGNEERLLKAHVELHHLLESKGAKVFSLGPPQFDTPALADAEQRVISYLHDLYQNNFIDARSYAKPMSGNVHLSPPNAKVFGQEAFVGFTGEAPPVQLSGARARTLSYLPQAKSASQKYGVPLPLILATIHHESGGNPTAISSAGALGLMQLMPATATQYGVNNAFDPAQNIDGGTHLLKDLLAKWGNLEQALSSYFAGSGNVQRHGWQRYGGYVSVTKGLLSEYAEVS
jgi:soluble lytic murein transglycosylase-like protein